MSKNEDDVFYGKRQVTGRIYVRIIEGRFAIAANEGDSGAESRENKNGKIVWEQYSEVMRLTIRSMGIRDTKFGRVFNLNSKKYTIEVPLGVHCQQFIQRLRNLDLSEPVALAPYKFPKKDDNEREIKGKFITGWQICQGGPADAPIDKDYKIDPYIKGGRDGDLPELKKVKDSKAKGGYRWDDSDIIDFLEEHLNTFLDENEEYKFKKGNQQSKDDDDDEEEEKTKKKNKSSKKQGNASKKKNKQQDDDDDWEDETPY